MSSPRITFVLCQTGLARHAPAAAQVVDHSRNQCAIVTIHAVDIFDQRVTTTDESGVQSVALLEPFEVRHGHSVIQIIGARREDVATGVRSFGRHHGIDVRIKERSVQPVQQVGQ